MDQSNAVAILNGGLLESILENHMAQIPQFLRPYVPIVAGFLVSCVQGYFTHGNIESVIINSLITALTSILKHDSPLGSNASTNK